MTPLPERISTQFGGVYRLLIANTTWMRSTIDFVVEPVKRGAAWLWAQVDVGIVDSTVNQAGEFVRQDSAWLSRVESGFVRNYALSIFLGAVVVIGISSSASALPPAPGVRGGGEWRYHGTPVSVLSTIIFLPSLGAMLAFLIASEELVKRMALITSALTFLISLIPFCMFDPSTAAMQFFERYDWIPALGSATK